MCFFFGKLDTCAVANLLEVFEGKVCISFHVGSFKIFHSAPESIKKSVSRSGERNSSLFGHSMRSGIVQMFSLGSCTCCFLIYIICA